MISPDVLRAWLGRFAELVAEHEQELTALDSAIGDADHGANMARGSKAAVDALAAHPDDDLPTLLKQVGMAMLSKVGGTSGPLYATLFMTLGKSLGDAAEIDDTAFAEALRAGLDALVKRGRTELQDKTMVDALSPALDALQERLAAGDDLPAALAVAQAAAEQGRDATCDMVARKGRASYLGERSVGHMDPGAASSVLLIRSLAEVA